MTNPFIIDQYTHCDTLNGSQILTEQFGNIFMVYLYDESGSPIGMQYRTNSMAEGTFYTYLFEKNLQGDIIAVYNTSGTKLISYVYDAWGNVTVTNHNVIGTNSGARHNPFRYRGYYYDTETGYYYLQSRYYNPKWGRFLNADSYLSTGTGLIGYNMYAYCNNNPIMYVDPTGEVIVTAIIVGAVSGAVIGGSLNGIFAYNSAKSLGVEGSDLFWATASGVGKGALIGGVAGGLGGATFGVVTTYGASFVAGTAMITGTLSAAAKATEIIVLQTRKTMNETGNGWQAANDSMNALINNRDKIFSPYLTKAASTIVTYKIQNFTNPLSFDDFLKSSRGKVFAYGFAVLAWFDTVRTIQSDDPISRAKERGYALE